MGVLNSWQKIDRVITNRPFGDGSAGNATISSDPNTRATASGSASSTSLTIGSAILSDGDVFAIHQTQGTGVGQWEINKVASGGGTTSITCAIALNYTYGTGAQVIKFSMNDVVTLSNHTVTGWDGSKGGVEVVCGRTSISGSGTITAVGGDSTGVGSTSSSNGGVGAGFSGGQAVQSNGQQKQGDGTAGAGGSSNSANGNGGGGANVGGSSGAGGGHASAGTNGTGTAVGGSSVGQADGTNINFGGGGGGGGSNNTSSTERSGGGGGGGIVILISTAIDISAGGITVNGGWADINNGGFWDGGAGAGGAVLMVCATATLGTNKATSVGGTSRGTIGAKTGSDGRITVQHSGTVTGTTNPTFTDVTDNNLFEQNETSGYFFMSY